MSTIEEIEAAIRRLSREEAAQLRRWLNDRSDEECGRQSTPSSAEIAQVARMLVAGTAGRDILQQHPSTFQRAAIEQGTAEWQAAFQKWVDSHHDVTVIADDSRESIYEGRGE